MTLRAIRLMDQISNLICYLKEIQEKMMNKEV